MVRKLFFLAFACVVVSGCNSGSKPAAPEATPANPNPNAAPSAAAAPPPAAAPLVVYSGRGEPLIAPVFAAFEKETGIDLQIKYGDTAQLGGALLEEQGRSPADVFVSQDASTLVFLEGKQQFAPIDRAVLDRAPTGFKSEQGRWIGLSGRLRVLAYHTGKVAAKDLPKSIDELTHARWKGRLGWAPENASFQSFVAAMVQTRGREATARWLKAMKANEPRAYPKNGPAVQAVSRGEVDAALVNHYYLYRLKQEQGGGEFPVENHYFPAGDPGALVNLSGVGVLASSKNQAAAQRLVAFLLSDAGQQHFVAGNHEFPIATGVASPSQLPPIERFKGAAVDPADLRQLGDTVALLRETQVLR